MKTLPPTPLFAPMLIVVLAFSASATAYTPRHQATAPRLSAEPFPAMEQVREAVYSAIGERCRRAAGLCPRCVQDAETRRLLAQLALVERWMTRAQAHDAALDATDGVKPWRARWYAARYARSFHQTRSALTELSRAVATQAAR